MKQLNQEAEKPHGQEAGGSSAIGSDAEAERMLLIPSNGKLIADMVEVPELDEHIHRAVKQVEKSLSAKRELNEEKEELDSVNKEAEK